MKIKISPSLKFWLNLVLKF